MIREMKKAQDVEWLAQEKKAIKASAGWGEKLASSSARCAQGRVCSDENCSLKTAPSGFTAASEQMSDQLVLRKAELRKPGA